MLQENNPELHWNWKNINPDEYNFPEDFIWGVATSSHQVEGNNANNNWYVWEQSVSENGQPRIADNQKSGAACDHWNRYRDDIRLMKEIGVNAYRFSVEWSKIEPGKGEFDKAVLDHYRKVCLALLDAGIKPVITLHHFTNPIWFDDLGGFEQEKNIDYFIRFSELVFDYLHDLVYMWCTINEPAVYTSQGYFNGEFPPGKQNPQLAGEVMKNLLEAHVRVYQALKARPGGEQSKIGLVKNIFQFDPYNRWNIFDWMISKKLNGLFTGTVLKFFKTGHFEFSLPTMAKVEHINTDAPVSSDFIGLNYYSHLHVKFRWNPEEFFSFEFYPEDTMTDMAYTIYPEGLYRAIAEISLLEVPIFITENGIADSTDDRRELFITRYLYSTSKALGEGYDVRGYFYWSLMDNFEWTEGYNMKFGLYEVDFKTQKRHLRTGAEKFVEIINIINP